ncbi:bifunctional DNA-formamidopyrimidine glycosylase/DNA-(apurinic or apyrimidinic site) lyase [Magnetospirillum sp. SS-4]|uniref:bifunctional DNA-formamidopyrimidine glycosylase/DNA-(apurinic or apyrimidinic site) lyase n=1 Tax=Magnetospirillum sp. SS-4 TaxID=2681465 RepID=UPI0013842FB3|nr:bifunctional DNA-formamidopyrimidine glycosylase/DNA-(apurinic or apyrimidinic site) lyase [Magnetospirillum sp. SS-4]CAA7612920.1 Formamidopyrimidine-DNA glycosylase [Magnetospirillum sp. SS-4]
MPELPEVETVARGLARVWEGRRFVAVVCRRDGLRHPFPQGFAESLAGRRVERVGRRAKYLVTRLDGGLVMLGHLGMSGRMVISSLRNVPPGPHDHVDFVTDDATLVTLTDPRRFGLLTLCRESELDAHPLLAGIGPEPLEPGFDAAALAAALAGRATPVKSALLDQRNVAGLGNIYVCESLFRAGISPLREAGSLSMAECEALVPAIRAVLEEAIAAGGSSLRDHVRPDGELGYFQHGFKVYGRAGQRCPGCPEAPACGGIQRIVQAGRSTFYCAERQR